MTQSVAIFSGSQRCGTMEKFWRTKKRASCVKAHKRLEAGGGRAAAELVDEPRGQADPTEPFGDDQRTDFADARGERRQLGAGLQLSADFAHHEPVRVAAQIIQIARQQMALARVRGNQLVQRLGVSLGTGSD